MGRREDKKALRREIESGDADDVRRIAAADPSLLDSPNSHHKTPLAFAIGAGQGAIFSLPRHDIARLLIDEHGQRPSCWDLAALGGSWGGTARMHRATRPCTWPCRGVGSGSPGGSSTPAPTPRS